MFWVEEKLTHANDNFKECFFMGRLATLNDYSKFDLNKFITRLASTIKRQDRKKIQILGYDTKININRIKYAILKNSAIEKGFTVRRTHVYFIAGHHLYYLIFNNEIANSNKYDFIIDQIAQSISCTDEVLLER